MPQSGEAGATPGSFTWNDRARTGDEIEMHLVDVRRQTPIGYRTSVNSWLSRTKDPPRLRPRTSSSVQLIQAAPARELVEMLRRHGGAATLDERDGLGHDYPGDMPATLTRALRFAVPSSPAAPPVRYAVNR